MSTGKPNARFLPTLTEVVRLQPSEVPAPASVTTDADPAAQLTQHTLALLEAQLAPRIEALLQAQAQNVLMALREEMKQAAAHAAQQALQQLSNSGIAPAE